MMLADLVHLLQEASMRRLGVAFVLAIQLVPGACASPSEPVLVDEDASVQLLMQASLDGRAEAVQELLSSGITVNACDEEGWTALMHAAKTGHTRVTELLLANGAEVNQPSENGSTALIVAAYYGHCDVVRLLLDAGADANAHLTDETTALDYAQGAGREDIASLLRPLMH